MVLNINHKSFSFPHKKVDSPTKEYIKCAVIFTIHFYLLNLFKKELY